MKNSKLKTADVFNNRTVSKLADRLETHARTFWDTKVKLKARKRIKKKQKNCLGTKQKCENIKEDKYNNCEVAGRMTS